MSFTAAQRDVLIIFLPSEFDSRRRRYHEVTFAASKSALSAAAAAAAEQAADPRPFGFLGVTRPPWTTRWEAHLTDGASGERIFLGNFDARESAARAYDAAALK